MTLFVTGTGVYWEQKPRDSNERSGVGPPTLADPSFLRTDQTS